MWQIAPRCHSFYCLLTISDFWGNQGPQCLVTTFSASGLRCLLVVGSHSMAWEGDWTASTLTWLWQNWVSAELLEQRPLFFSDSAGGGSQSLATRLFQHGQVARERLASISLVIQLLVCHPNTVAIFCVSQTNPLVQSLFWVLVSHPALGNLVPTLKPREE